MPRTASLRLFLETGGKTTLQQQIYLGIRQHIVDGRVAADRRLPSTRALAADLGVSRTTALHALEQLRAEGFVVARKGSGMYASRELPIAARPPAVKSAPPIARPSFSRRGLLLAGMGAPDRRAAGTPARAFRLGTPALDVFPQQLWSRLTRECLRSLTSAHRDYSQLAGLRELREAIAEQMQSRGTRCMADQVHIVTGAQRGLDLIARMLLDPGDTALLEEPGYTGARGALLAAGARLLPVPVDGEGLDIGSVDISDARLAYVTPSCQFPLGMAMSTARRKALLDWARRSHAWIIEDDYDCDLRYDRQPLPCLHALDPDGRVVYLGTFSKTVFPSLRLGFLIVPSDLIDGFLAARLSTDLHPPVLEQRVLTAFIQRGHYDRHLRRMHGVYAERRQALQRVLPHTGAPFSLQPVQAGMHAVVNVDGVDAERLHLEALRRGIESMPLTSYYQGAGPRPNALLLGFGAVPPAAIRSGAVRLAKLTEEVSRCP